MKIMPLSHGMGKPGIMATITVHDRTLTSCRQLIAVVRKRRRADDVRVRKLMQLRARAGVPNPSAEVSRSSRTEQRRLVQHA